jgi:predicted nucleic acid-binding protein
MKRVFADTYFFLAALNTRDADHERALGYFAQDDIELITTAWVLTEVAATLAPRATRASFVQLYASLRADTGVTVIPAEPTLFDRGLALYSRRLDKDWSLTDCISFVVMEEQYLSDALTGDHHFEQAGFTTLLG